VGIGEKSLAKGEVEIKPRSGAIQAVKIEAAASTVIEWVQSELKRLSPQAPVAV
jgi:hypothetical protein